MSRAEERKQARRPSPAMQGPHASPDELALFVMDALDASTRRRFERHVMACAVCGEALAREAAAEVALHAAWPAMTEAVERPLAPVLPLHPVPVPVAVAAPVVPVSAPTTARRTTVRRTTARAAGASASWNSFAAAAMTVLFLGYWTDGGRATDAHGRAGFAALDGVMTGPASCGSAAGLEPGVCASSPASPLLCSSGDSDLRACVAVAVVDRNVSVVSPVNPGAPMSSIDSAGLCSAPTSAGDGICALPL
jgi:hypothetical protein